MPQMINIHGYKFEVIDSMNYITLADSFVLNKIGNGHGEGKLYVGNESADLFDFFDDFSRRCFISRNDMINYMNEMHSEFLNPTQNYKDPTAVHMNYLISLHEMEEAKEDLLYFNIFQSHIAPPRVYINSRSTIYAYIRKVGLPNLSYLSIMKLRMKNEILYYFKIFSDFLEAVETIETEKILENKGIDYVKKEVIITARKGQGKYREGVLNDCLCCPFTLVNDERLLIASHIKPWAKCEEKEKTDKKNGFAFTPTYDKLFDFGFITFNDDKSLVVSPWLSPINQKRLGIHSGKKITKLPLDDSRKKYLKYHRENIFKG